MALLAKTASFTAVLIHNMDEIDKSKENIQPLRQGRNTEQLRDALSEAKQRNHITQMQ